MRSHIEIDDDVLDAAVRAGPFKTKKDAVESGLKLLARQATYREILKRQGKLRWHDHGEGDSLALPAGVAAAHYRGAPPRRTTTAHTRAAHPRRTTAACARSASRCAAPSMCGWPPCAQSMATRCCTATVTSTPSKTTLACAVGRLERST